MNDKKDNRFKKRWLAYLGASALIIAVMVAAIIAQMDFKTMPNRDLQATYTVQRQDLPISVTESGEIRTLESVNILAEAEETKTIVSIVPEGTVITEDDVQNGLILFELDSWELQEDYLYHQIDYVDSEADYLDADHEYKIQIKQNASDIKIAELTVKFTRMDLQRFLSESLAQELLEMHEMPNTDVDNYIVELIEEMTGDPNDSRWGGAALQQKRKLEASIKLAAGQLEKDRNQLRGTQRLHSNGYVALSELERDKLAFSRSQTNLQKATTAMQLFLKFDFPKQCEKLFSDYVEAGNDLLRIHGRARSKVSQANSRLISRKAIFNRNAERARRYERELAACIVKAPVSGLVIYGSSEDYWKKNTDPIEIGDGVEKGQKIITIPNRELLSVKLGIREEWIDKIKANQTAKIIIDPFPDTVFSGRVEKVAPLPDSRRQSSIRLYSTQVSLSNDNGRILPGMSARVEIIIENLTDVLCVPIQAVIKKKGDKICYIVSDTGIEQRTVVTGQFNEAFVEIVEGLEEGEKVSLIPTQHTLKSEGKTVP